MKPMREGVRFHMCDCGDEDHALFTDSFIWEGDPEMDTFILGVQLAPYNVWYKRIWLALKYVFNPHGKHSHWHSTDISDPTAIRDHINEYLAAHANNPESEEA